MSEESEPGAQGQAQKDLGEVVVAGQVLRERHVDGVQDTLEEAKFVELIIVEDVEIRLSSQVHYRAVEDVQEDARCHHG